MELLIAILLCLGLCASPEQLSEEEFVNANRETIDYGNRVIENNWYYYNSDGGIVIDPAVGTWPIFKPGVISVSLRAFSKLMFSSEKPVFSMNNKKRMLNNKNINPGGILLKSRGGQRRLYSGIKNLTPGIDNPSFAIGGLSNGMGNSSFVMGSLSNGIGNPSFGIGSLSNAIGNSCFTIGYLSFGIYIFSNGIGNSSFAIGDLPFAKENFSLP